MLYLPAQVVTCSFIAVLNVPGLAIFRGNNVLTIAAAVIYALVFGLGVHQVGLAVRAPERRRWLSWGALGLLIALFAGTLVLADLRVSFFRELGLELQTRSFVILQLIVDAVAVGAAILHANPIKDSLDAALDERDRGAAVLMATKEETDRLHSELASLEVDQLMEVEEQLLILESLPTVSEELQARLVGYIAELGEAADLVEQTETHEPGRQVSRWRDWADEQDARFRQRGQDYGPRLAS